MGTRQFLKLKKSLYIAWASFRYVMTSIYSKCKLWELPLSVQNQDLMVFGQIGENSDFSLTTSLI